jgi:protease I
MDMTLDGIKVAVLVDNGFEEVELYKPVDALRLAGAKVEVISKEKKIKGWNKTDWGRELDADILLEDSDPLNYNALLLPGGVMNPDYLRINPLAVEFVKHFMERGKPIAAICHGPWTLIETGMVEGRTMTSFPSLKTDLMNAGVQWVDKEVVVDSGIVTSRNPDDLPAFIKKMIEEFKEGIHMDRRDLNDFTKNNILT